MVTGGLAVTVSTMGASGGRARMGAWRSLQFFEGCRNDWEKVDCRGLMLAPENEAGNLES